MSYLLDTNILIAILKKESKLLDKLRTKQPDKVFMPSIASYELLYGAYKSQRTQHNLSAINTLRFPTLDFSIHDAEQAAIIRKALERKGTPIGAYDILIAGQALARNLILVTRNVKEFSRIAKLQYENW